MTLQNYTTIILNEKTTICLRFVFFLCSYIPTCLDWLWGLWVPAGVKAELIRPGKVGICDSYPPGFELGDVLEESVARQKTWQARRNSGTLP